jgi:hypothetical protein
MEPLVGIRSADRYRVRPRLGRSARARSRPGALLCPYVAGRASRCRGAHFGDPDAPRSRRPSVNTRRARGWESAPDISASRRCIAMIRRLPEAERRLTSQPRGCVYELFCCGAMIVGAIMSGADCNGSAISCCRTRSCAIAAWTSANATSSTHHTADRVWNRGALTPP